MQTRSICSLYLAFFNTPSKPVIWCQCTRMGVIPFVLPQHQVPLIRWKGGGGGDLRAIFLYIHMKADISSPVKRVHVGVGGILALWRQPLAS